MPELNVETQNFESEKRYHYTIIESKSNQNAIESDSSNSCKQRVGAKRGRKPKDY